MENADQDSLNRRKTRFESSGDAIKELQTSFNSWTLNLTAICVNTCYAIIAGIFTAFSTTGLLLKNYWAIASFILVFIVLVTNIMLRKFIIDRLYNRIEEAENNSEKWEIGFKAYCDKRNKETSWPYTKRINKMGMYLRLISTWGVAFSALFLIIGFVTNLKK